MHDTRAGGMSQGCSSASGATNPHTPPCPATGHGCDPRLDRLAERVGGIVANLTESDTLFVNIVSAGKGSNCAVRRVVWWWWWCVFVWVVGVGVGVCGGVGGGGGCVCVCWGGLQPSQDRRGQTSG